MAHAYPILLDVTDRPVLIVGGGKVAARKAAGLLAAGAQRVKAVAERFDPDFPAEVERIEAAYEPGLLDGMAMVFAATDSPEVNEAVARDARQRGALVNRVDAGFDVQGSGFKGEEVGAGDFTVPAVIRDGGLMVAVSAGSAALSVKVRDELAGRLDPGWGKLAEAMRILRPRVLADERLDAAARRAILHDLSTPEAMRMLEEKGLEGLWREVMRRRAKGMDQ